MPFEFHLPDIGEGVVEGEIVKWKVAEGDTVTLVGFGTFQVRKRAERQGRNPKTGETIKIKASKNPAFKAGKALKDAVNYSTRPPMPVAVGRVAARVPTVPRTGCLAQW